MSASLGAIYPKDHAQFQEDVVFGDNAKATDSELEVTNHSIGLGTRTPALCFSYLHPDCLTLSAFAQVGYAFVEGSRYIPKCTDCTKQGLSLKNGGFAELGLEVGSRPEGKIPGFLAITSYRHALPGTGLVQEFRIGVGLAF